MVLIKKYREDKFISVLTKILERHCTVVDDIGAPSERGLCLVTMQCSPEPGAGEARHSYASTLLGISDDDSGLGDLTLLEAFLLIWHKKDNFAWLDDDEINAISCYMVAIADLLIRGKVSLTWQVKKPISAGIATKIVGGIWSAFSSDIEKVQIRIVSDTPLNNSLDPVLHGLKSYIKELGSDGAAKICSIIEDRIQLCIVNFSQADYSAFDLPNDRKTRCGFRPARNALEAKGIIVFMLITMPVPIPVQPLSM